MEPRDLGRDEPALVQALLAGEETAFEVFADSYIPVVYRFAQRRLADRELCREIAQATICKAIAKLATFRGEAGLSTWLCACCQNEIAAHFRRQGRAGREVALNDAAEPALASAAPGPEQALLYKEDAGLVHAALDALPHHYSRVLEWKYLDHLPVDAIAARLGARPKAVESLLTRARQSFREIYRRLARREPPEERARTWKRDKA